MDISICWLRRDLRLADHAALYHALKSGYPVLPLFIFDQNILNKLDNKKDARLTFIHQTLKALREELQQYGCSLLVKFGSPEKVWPELIKTYQVKAVYANHDYEPYAIKRDDGLAEYLRSEEIPFYTYKDQVIFEQTEVVKADGKPYTVLHPTINNGYKSWMHFI